MRGIVYFGTRTIRKNPAIAGIVFKDTIGYHFSKQQITSQAPVNGSGAHGRMAKGIKVRWNKPIKTPSVSSPLTLSGSIPGTPSMLGSAQIN